ncbi:MAG: hypothetical protein K9K88_04805 [Desulfobacterales bacterium]|nr:hypothetical protein [Desulfobacterales bacterium]
MGREKKESKSSAPREVTIIGYVDEVEAEDGSPAIQITTEDDERYRVHSDHKGDELFDFLDEEVAVSGVVQKDRRGTPVITVKNYEVIDDYDDYDDDEDEYIDREDDYDNYDDDDDFRPTRRKAG